MQPNYQKEMDALLLRLRQENRRPRLMLHSCCGPCSSYVLEYLSAYFDITVFYYNPNIFPRAEYEKRRDEQLRLLREMAFSAPVSAIVGDYAPGVFDEAAKGQESAPEGGARCARCFMLRLEETAKVAKAHGYDYFGTTLSVSPHKNARVINEIGSEISKQYGVSYLASDFKKREGYKRSIQLSREYNLYRQDYCGCRYSAGDRFSREI